jgi:phosphatidylinositol alpha-1,6-mannosyltransferase
MNILFLTASYPPEIGGIAELVQGFAEGLTRHEIRVHVLAATPGAAQLSNERLPVTEFELPAGGYLKRVAACRRAVMDLMKQEPVDRLLVSTWSPCAVHLPSRANNHALPIDLMCHGMDLLEPARSGRYRFLMSRTLRRADNVLANSRYTAEMAHKLGARKDSVIVVPPGIDPDQFSPGEPDQALLSRYCIPPGTPVLLSLGRLVERKGFDLVIRALPSVLRVNPAAVYLIVGDGPDRNRLSDLALTVGIANKVCFAGEIPESERCAHYRLAKVFVMPSRVLPERGDVEGFGIVFMEAACCEVPSVGGRSGGIPDAIEDGVTGYLADPFGPADIADKINFLLSNEEQRQKMGRAARQRASTMFDWPSVISRYLARIR